MCRINFVANEMEVCVQLKRPKKLGFGQVARRLLQNGLIPFFLWGCRKLGEIATEGIFGGNFSTNWNTKIGRN
jgi:hypothetical protein